MRTNLLALTMLLIGGWLVYCGAKNISPTEAATLLLQGKDPTTAHPIMGVNAVWHDPPADTQPR